MKSDIPKQFMLLNGEPMLSHSLKAFVKAVPSIEVILVLPPKLNDVEKKLVSTYIEHSNASVVTGGEQRFDSVKNALASISEDGVVAIHDAARPFISVELIQKCFSVAEENGCAIPVIPLSDSLLKVEDNSIISVSRSNLFRCQTPQCFQLSKIKLAYSKITFEPKYTDDASVWEAAGNAIQIIPGEMENFKVSTMVDFHLAEQLTSKIL